jgi:hypothetical protein
MNTMMRNNEFGAIPLNSAFFPLLCFFLAFMAQFQEKHAPISFSTGTSVAVVGRETVSCLYTFPFCIRSHMWFASRLSKSISVLPADYSRYHVAFPLHSLFSLRVWQNDHTHCTTITMCLHLLDAM